MSQTEPNDGRQVQSQSSFLRSGLIGAGWYVVLLGIGVGCVNWGGDRPLGWRVTDPPGLSPYHRPLAGPVAGSPQQAARPVVPEGIPSDELLAERDPITLNAPELSEAPRPQLDAPEPGASNTRERPVPDGIAAFDPLTVTAEMPETATVGSPVSLTLTLRNETPFAAEDVRVQLRYGSDWEFPGTGERNVEQRLGTIAADRSREVALQLTPVRVGRRCVDVEVLSATHEAVSRTVCTHVGERLVTLEVAGPDRRTVGSRAEYVVTLTNQAGRPVEDTVVAVDYPQSLDLKELSAGATREPGRLEWDLGTLLEQERVQIQLEFECAEAAADVCTRMVVTSRGMSVSERSACLSVVDPALLDVQVSDENDPAAVGETATFRVRLQNRSSRPAGRLELLVDPSAELELAALLRDGQTLAARRSGDAQILTPRGPLAPGAVVEYEVRTVARSAGIATLSVVVRSDVLIAPLEIREPLLINPPVTGRE
ncbi:MAG: hypothetical protein DWQ34_27410 [Planctomycetota bacterium]|nr:MAG: hypothetical protein DWQ34_27410 [Planctomycetota bacterium]REJ90552.1 MAG: hypothetical protein DWQ29_06575 [Planctomycetota bacterium]REK24089.1 MAG: hypothetical protein DWQ41_13635 [Planctomycetota bacterium]